MATTRWQRQHDALMVAGIAKPRQPAELIFQLDFLRLQVSPINPWLDRRLDQRVWSTLREF